MILGAVVGVTASAVAATSGNMNGAYKVATGNRQDAPFNADYKSKGHEYFDIWSPEMETHYGEALWHNLGNVALPQEVIDRFKGKVMAITGYEQDQVMKTDAGDVSVPINWAYNHHYMAWMTGSHSALREVQADPDDTMAHGAPTKFVTYDLPSAAERTQYKNAPTSQMFSEGNGGESRKSFHGYPNRYAQLIHSPTTWRITPMQIDTRNRECGVTPADVTNCTKHNPVPYSGFTPGPEPTQARFGLGAPKDTIYSGLLECPCSTRYGGDSGNKTKVVIQTYNTFVKGQCTKEGQVTRAGQCFEAVASLPVSAAGPALNMTITDASKPSGCLVAKFSNGTVAAIFNHIGAAGTDTKGKVEGHASSAVKVGLGVSLDQSVAGGIATLTLSGPANVWFGVGFGASQMSDQPYTIIVQPDSVFEQHLGTCGSEADHCPGDKLPVSIKVISNTVSNGVRNVVVTRPFVGKLFSFDLSKTTTWNFITAVGSAGTFAYHGPNHAPVSISLTATGGHTQVCFDKNTGLICQPGQTKCNSFTKSCAPEPHGDLLAQYNPTCNSRQYVGGLRCCIDGQNLLDVDQEIPSATLNYHMKFRFWFQEYTEDNSTGNASHYNLDRFYYQTEANAGEYDIPPAFGPTLGYEHLKPGQLTPGTTCSGNCPNGTDCECQHTITAHWNVSNMRLIYAGGHCHAPACLSMELYRADTGALLCRQVPVVGQGNTHEDRFDEEGYIAIPPCLWGPEEEGLEPSFLLPANTPLVAIKRNRNTHTGHFGEMASWQMRGTKF